MNFCVVYIYKKLCESYPIYLKSSLDVSPNFKVDFPVLCGASTLGRFEVFFDDVSFPFYAMREDGDVYEHWHLQTPDEVERAVVNFMDGKNTIV